MATIHALDDIVFIRDRFVPDNATCQTTMTLNGDTLRCGQTAVLWVAVRGHERVVCHDHLVELCRQKWPERKA